MTQDSASTGAGAARFPVTHWSVLGRARHSPEDGADRRTALEELARLYWRPIYAYVRLRWKESSEEAKDLTQEFFLHLMEGSLVDSAEPGHGTFRTFLKRCLDNFVRNQIRNEHAMKRGGDRQKLSIDFGTDPDQFLLERPSDSAEETLDRHWREAVLDEAIRGMEEAYRQEGRSAYFHAFQKFDLHSEEATRPTYDALATSIGVSRTEIEYYLRHARKRLLQTVKEILATSVSTSEELKNEEDALFS